MQLTVYPLIATSYPASPYAILTHLPRCILPLFYLSFN